MSTMTPKVVMFSMDVFNASAERDESGKTEGSFLIIIIIIIKIIIILSEFLQSKGIVIPI